MCLSESTFLSLRHHFEGNIEALGYTRFLKLFEKYFANIQRIESVKWLHLFSDHCPEIIYKQIIFIGKDREGSLRQRWQGFSKEPLIFIDMYPENSSAVSSSKLTAKPESVTHNRSSIAGSIHVEDYQLAQLAQYGIKAIKKTIQPKPLYRTILYPERGFEKKKWSVDNFVELYKSLKSKNINTCILESLGMNIDVKDKMSFQELSDIKEFFQDGGIFVSNDSGMAHLAGMCGLFSITIFIDFNPLIWHPRGRFMTFRQDAGMMDISVIETEIIERMSQDL